MAEYWQLAVWAKKGIKGKKDWTEIGEMFHNGGAYANRLFRHHVWNIQNSVLLKHLCCL